MFCTYFILVTLFIIDLVGAITPFLTDAGNVTASKITVIKNKKLLANAVYVFEKSELPLCSRRYQKISNAVCSIKICGVASNVQALRDFCVADFGYYITS